MTLYAGEKNQISHWAKGYDREQLTDDEVTATITIWDLDGTTVLVNEAAMTWDENLTSEDDPPQVGGWFYIWSSPAGAPGAYLARLTVTGAGGISAWEYKTIRLRRDKAPV